MTIVASIKKNSREEIRITRELYRGHDIVSIRTFFEADDGSRRPGKSGIGIRVGLLPDVLAALREAANAKSEV